jgi:hypothetical protein
LTPHSAARHGERQNRILDSPHHHRTPQPVFMEQSTSQQRLELPQYSIEGDDPFAPPSLSLSAARENLAALRAAATVAGERLLPINRRSRGRGESSSGVNHGVLEGGINQSRGRPSISHLSQLSSINQYQHLPAHLQTALAQLHPQHENNAIQPLPPAPVPAPAPAPASVPPLNPTPLPLGRCQFNKNNIQVSYLGPMNVICPC